MYKVIILPFAKQDIKENANWYEKQQKGLGKTFTKEVRKTVDFIKKNPKSISIRYDNTRTAIVKIFPIMIHFIIEEKKKIIIISSVFSTARNPEDWTNR